MSSMNAGTLYAISAYLLWGLLPLYWKLLKDVPASEILSHRIVWSFMLTVFLIALQRNRNWLTLLLKNNSTLRYFIGSAIIIGLNWFTYIWAVNHGFIVEASLGYFINPLISVILGVMILKEKLRSFQWFAISIAAAGVMYLTFKYGSFPWISFVLAFSFGFYGLLRKTAALNSLQGLTVEMSFLFLPALIFLVLKEANGNAAFLHANWPQNILLVLTGIVTTLPLLLFAAGARLIRLSKLGILQYIAPTLQFLIGVFIFHEQFPSSRFIGFVIIWIALAIYTGEGIYAFQRRRRFVSADWEIKSKK